ncbi:hypothetical protein BGZ83_001267 [Gryganskiella cystojenkinii]|nr:hypothetical protein BGZ83_001267 [Gryganskiella cystojenkinii]
MDSLDPAEKVFTTPELVEMIVCYLDRDELASLDSTCKLIHEAVATYPWRDYDLGDTSEVNQIPSPGLLQNLHHIRTVRFNTTATGLLDILLGRNQNQQSLPPSLSPPPSTTTTTTATATTTATTPPLTTRVATALTSNTTSRTTNRSQARNRSPSHASYIPEFLYTGADRSGKGSGISAEYLDRILMILKQIKALETVKLLGLLLEKEDKLAFVLASQPRLKSLTIVHSVQGQSFSKAFDFLTSCLALPTLETLHCSFSVEFTLREDDLPASFTFNKVTTSAYLHRLNGRFPIGLRDLELPYYVHGYPKWFLVPFYRLGFPALETFHLPRLDSHLFDDLEEALTKNSPNLCKLRMSGMWYSTAARDYQTLGLFNRCYNERGCRSLEFACMPWSVFHRDCVAFHQWTLPSLQIRNPHKMTSVDMNVILTACPALEIFKIEGFVPGFQLDFADFQKYKVVEPAGENPEVTHDGIEGMSREELEVEEQEEEEEEGNDDDDDYQDDEEEEEEDDNWMFENRSINFACLRLKTLSMVCYGLWWPHNYSNQGFYSQLGKLIELEELTLGFTFAPTWMLGPPMLDFTLVSPYGRLQELKDL